MSWKDGAYDTAGVHSKYSLQQLRLLLGMMPSHRRTSHDYSSLTFSRWTVLAHIYRRLPSTARQRSKPLTTRIRVRKTGSSSCSPIHTLHTWATGSHSPQAITCPFSPCPHRLWIRGRNKLRWQYDRSCQAGGLHQHSGERRGSVLIEHYRLQWPRIYLPCLHIAKWPGVNNDRSHDEPGRSCVVRL